jgi:hypothetical protein
LRRSLFGARRNAFAFFGSARDFDRDLDAFLDDQACFGQLIQDRVWFLVRAGPCAANANLQAEVFEFGFSREAILARKVWNFYFRRAQAEVNSADHSEEKGHRDC